jgi:uncharacterized protein (TIGR01777 family)
MRIIITGGTGLIGQALSADLAADNHEVIILSRNPDGFSGNLPKGASIHQWDAKSAEGWGHLADGADAIINLAGAGIADKRWSEERKIAILQSRLDAGKAVVEAVEAAKAKPRVVIQASAVGFYGAREDEILTESGSMGDDFPATVSKHWEPSTEAVEAMGVRRVVARIGVVLIKDGGALPRMVQPIQMGVGGKIGTGRQWMSWIHIDDVVRALRFLITQENARGVFNVTSPQPARNVSLTNEIGNTINRPTLIPVPKFALSLIFGEMATVLTTGQRVVPEKLEEMGFAFRYPAIGQAIHNLLATTSREAQLVT